MVRNNLERTSFEYLVNCQLPFMVPALFHDVTHDKMKSNLIIIIAGLHLNHS